MLKINLKRKTVFVYGANSGKVIIEQLIKKGVENTLPAPMKKSFFDLCAFIDVAPHKLRTIFFARRSIF